MQNVYFITLCGGSGTRLWPLSTKKRPKQLIPFINNKTLLEDTIDRISHISDKKHIGICTTKEQSKLIPNYIKEKIGFVIEEPVPKNTGPAILYSCFEILKKDKNSISVFLASDHYIPGTEKYCSYLKKAIEHAQTTSNIINLGLVPKFSSTGYGYIQVDSKKINSGEIYPVKKFHEKPNTYEAEQYVKQKNMLWNISMFVGKTNSFIREFQFHTPKIYFSIKNNAYENSPKTSIDYAIMEKSKNISVLPCDFEWSDVGNLKTFLEIQQKHQKESSQIINIDSKNNSVKSNKKIVTFIGVDNLCIVETDDTILISKIDLVERVKEVSETIN